MNYEEKYKQAMKVMKEFVKRGSITKEFANAVFPEIKESEEERILRRIINIVDEYSAKHQIDNTDCIDWLEKQGEHANFRNKIQIGDKVTRNEDGALVNLSQLKRVAQPANVVESEKQGEQKPSQEIVPFEAEHGKYYYCIKDYFSGGKKQASKGDVVQALRGLPIMGLKDASKYFLPVNSIKYNSVCGEEDEKMLESIITCADKDYFIRKEQINWLKSLKDRVQPQPKQEWSEEDETRLTNTIIMLKEGASLHFNKKDITKAVDWLKSLRPQNTWKPSDRQIQTLEFIIEYHAFVNGDRRKDIVALLSDLKKLREE